MSSRATPTGSAHLSLYLRVGKPPASWCDKAYVWEARRASVTLETGGPVVTTVVAACTGNRRWLGEGGMGIVFLAENESTGKLVAVKWLQPEGVDQVSRTRLLREARAACKVNHPHVVDVYDVSEHDGTPFIVMEFLKGKSLRQVA